MYLDYTGLYQYTLQLLSYLGPYLTSGGVLSFLTVVPVFMALASVFLAEPLTDAYLVLFYIFEPSYRVAIPRDVSWLLMWANGIAWVIKSLIVFIVALLNGDWTEALLGTSLINIKMFTDQLYPTYWYSKGINLISSKRKEQDSLAIS
jgi:hypothetical protein